MPDGEKVALITGAGRGLGRATAEALAADGMALFLVDVRADLLAESAAVLTAKGARVETHVADIAERSRCFAAVDAAIGAYGRLDVLCNVAGIVRFNHATEVPEAEWNLIFAINASAPFWFCQAAIPHLLKTGGNIVNVASQAAKLGTAYIVPYSASKGALMQMTKSLAMEYVDSPIRINAVAPGTMVTGIGEGVVRPEGIDDTLMARYSGRRPPNDPAEVAALIAFVASDRASAIHGAVLHADGGATTG
jgi:NAD(P)-dependent dehydrogenase (short-subunit alcohol dehydrogenase family)